MLYSKLTLDPAGRGCERGSLGQAVHLAVTPEDLVRVSIEELLARPEETFQQAVDYVLHKNAELYRRLA